MVKLPAKALRGGRQKRNSKARPKQGGVGIGVGHFGDLGCDDFGGVAAIGLTEVWWNRRVAVMISALIVVLGYCGVRAWVYGSFPIGSTEDWIVRDGWMTIPRLGAFGALLALNRGRVAARFDWREPKLGMALALGGPLILLWAFKFGDGDGDRFQASLVVGGFFTSAAVALFEELAFRGVLLADLQSKWATIPAILVGSVLFAVFHFQAQSVRGWLGIFLTGVILSNLRVRGITLAGLAIIHTLIDTLFFVFGLNDPDLFGTRGLIFQGGLLVYAVATFPKGKGVRAAVGW